MVWWGPAMNDTELDELERFEALVRGPGWTPDIDKGADYEEWTGKWYTPPRPDGTGGFSLALYADDEEILYAKYFAALRNAAPRLIRAARRLAEFDGESLVAENEALRRKLCEVERERDGQRERAEAGTRTVVEAMDLALKYHEKRDELRKVLGAKWNESVEEAAARLATEPSTVICEAAKKYALTWQKREAGIASVGPREEERAAPMLASMTRVCSEAHLRLLAACGIVVADTQTGVTMSR